MSELIKKDFILHRSILLFITAITIIFCLIIQEAKLSSYLSIICNFSIYLPFFYMIRESRNNANSLLKSFPVTQNNILAGYYITAWMFFIFGIIVNLLTAFVMIKLSGITLIYQPFQSYVSTVFWNISILTINIAFFFPTIIVYGMGRALIISILFANIALSRIFYISGKGDFIYSLILISESVKSFARNFSGYMINTFGEPFYYLSFVFIIFLINYISYRITVFLFTRKEFQLAY